MSKPCDIDIDLLRDALAEAWPKFVTANDLATATGYGTRSISQLLRPAGRTLNIERDWVSIPRSGAKLMAYRLPGRAAQIEMRPLKPKPAPKPRAASSFGHIGSMGLPHETKDIDPIKSLPVPTRRAVEWLRRDGWAVWPWGLGWQVGNLMLSEQELIDLAERRAARTAA